MHGEGYRSALAALEIVLRGVLLCQSGDVVDIVTSAGDNDLPEVHGFTVTRQSQLNGQMSRVYFLDMQNPIAIDGKLYGFGSNLVNAANIFLREVFSPGFRGHGHSVERLIAHSRELNLEEELADAAAYVGAQRRLYPKERE